MDLNLMVSWLSGILSLDDHMAEVWKFNYSSLFVVPVGSFELFAECLQVQSRFFARS